MAVHVYNLYIYVCFDIVGTSGAEIKVFSSPLLFFYLVFSHK